MTQKFETLEMEQLENGTPEDKIIIIKSIFSKEAKLKLQPTKNDMNRRYVGIETNLSEMEKLKRGYLPTEDSAVTIKDGLTFDLNNPQDAADWGWIKHSVHIADNFDAAQTDPRAWYYVFRQGEESRKKLNSMEKELEILNLIAKDTPANLYNRVRLLGIDMTGQPISDVKEYLMSAAKDNRRVDEIVDLYKNSNISVKLMLYHGLDNGVIVFDGFAYKYGNILLGTTEALVLEYLTNPMNVAIIKEIENRIYPKKEDKSDNALKEDPMAKARAAKAAKAANAAKSDKK